MTRSKQITIGADIEVFVAKRETREYVKKEKFLTADGDVQIRQAKKRKVVGGEIVPCVDIFPGTKEKPHTFKDWKAGFAVQEDNVMLEFNIPPAKSASELIDTMAQARKYITDMCKTKDLMPMWNIPEYKFKPIDLMTPQAKLFGCEPDLDAYSGGTLRDSIPDFGFYRTCGGHIHLGGDFNCPDFVAVLFLELVMALWMGNKFVVQPGSVRSKWYGRPGVYREKPYGIEYRTLNNAWATSGYGTNDLAGLVFQVGNILVSNSAKSLQQWFRRIEWTKVQKLLTTIPSTKDKEKYFNYSKEWQYIRTQFSGLQIPGLQL
jgi:hypothetical protein